jgi:hypothetical protein
MGSGGLPPQIAELPNSTSAFAREQSGGAGESRTPDLRFRKPPLYPSELQPHCSGEFNAD